MKSIKQLAIKFLSLESTDCREAKEILNKVNTEMRSWNYKSYNHTLKKLLNVSYFAGINSSSKISKGEKLEYYTLILYLLPSDQSGVDICAGSCLGCELACLSGAGHSGLEERSVINGKKEYNKISVSRLVKTWLVVFRRDIANKLIQFEIDKNKSKYKRFAVRLNGTSDLPFYDIICNNPNIQFYDYTKMSNRYSLDNYHVTFSYSTSKINRIKHYKQALQRNQNLAFPVTKQDYKRILSLPDTFDMDTTDLRFLDNKKSKYGILIAKETINTQCGIDEKFILTYEDFVKVIDAIENN